ncbi:MAG: LytTR family DNA-binding domain-containing protein [Agriterribacter sp.]
MIECFVIDDEYPAVEVLENYINQNPLLKLIGSSTNPVEGLEMIRMHKPQVVFLDIEMQELNGLDLKQLMDKNILTIFCTAYSEYAIKSYELQAADYLVKPISHNRFIRAIHRLTEQFASVMQKTNTNPAENFITVKADHKGKIFKLDYDEIDFIESLGNYVAIHRGKNRILTYNTMKDVEGKLPKDIFIRIHKSFIVPLKQISYIEYNEIALKNSNKRFPIGNSYKPTILEMLKEKLL